MLLKSAPALAGFHSSALGAGKETSPASTTGRGSGTELSAVGTTPLRGIGASSVTVVMAPAASPTGGVTGPSKNNCNPLDWSCACEKTSSLTQLTPLTCSAGGTSARGENSLRQSWSASVAP